MTCEHTSVNLCGKCEALPIPVHPISHPLVKFKQASPANDRLASSVRHPRIEHAKSVPQPRPPLTNSNLERWNTVRSDRGPPPLPPRQPDTESIITVESVRSALTEEPDQCPVCFEDRKGQMVIGASCGHMLCRECRAELLAAAKTCGDKPRCYSCRQLYD